MIVVAWYQGYEPGYVEGEKAVIWKYGREQNDIDAAKKHVIPGNISCKKVFVYPDGTDTKAALEDARKKIRTYIDDVKWIKLD